MPYERFTITRRADIETTALVLAVGIAVTEIAVRGRRQQAAAARRAGYLDGISAASRAVATGAEPRRLLGQVRGQLTALLGLSACRFQDGAAGIGSPPRLLRDGRVVIAGLTWTRSWRGCRRAGIPSCWPRPAACCRAGSCSPPARGPARAWSSGWSPSAWPTRQPPHWPAPGWPASAEPGRQSGPARAGNRALRPEPR